MNRTQNLGLPQFEPTDRYRLEDYNEAYVIIDEALTNLEGELGAIDEINEAFRELSDDLYSELQTMQEGLNTTIQEGLDTKADEGHTHEAQVNCDTVDGIHIAVVTQEEYDALETKAENTLYLIKKEVV